MTISKEIKLDLEEYKSIKDDIGNLECDLCDYSCQKENETWWEYENDDNVLIFCDRCIIT